MKAATSIQHGQSPNGDHLRLCERSLFDPDVDLPTGNFLALLVFGSDYETNLCPECVDAIERRVRTWRRLTRHSYQPLEGEEDDEEEEDEAMTDDAAFRAAQWWVQRLRTPASFDNGDAFTSLVGRLASSAAANPTEEAIEAFASFLRDAIRRRLDEGASVVRLSVDYNPEDLLAEVVERAQIRGVMLPCKTLMDVYPDRVKVSEGYRAAWVQVWPAPEG